MTNKILGNVAVDAGDGMGVRGRGFRRGESGAKTRCCLETVNFDRALGNALFNQEVENLGTLISLELDNLSCFFVVYESAVASEFLHISVRY